MKNWGILFIFLIFGSIAYAQCFTIETVLADACGDPEGENEMVTLLANQNLDINNLSVDWPNNNFLSWCYSPTKTAQLNQTIISSCGLLLEPPQGIVPAGEKLIIVTSTNMLVTANSFALLTDTIYILYQCAGNTHGHFSNANPGTRTLEVSYNGTCISAQTVSYAPTSLIGGDGGAIAYDTQGNSTYFNTGCNAPIPSLNPYWTFPSRICTDYSLLDLNDFLSSNATLGGSWSGDIENGHFFNPLGKLGSYNVMYSVTSNNACIGSADSSLQIIVEETTFGRDTVLRCDSIYQFGNWIYSDTILNITVANPNTYLCDSTVRRFYQINSNNYSVSPTSIQLNSGNDFQFEINGANYDYEYWNAYGDSCIFPCTNNVITPNNTGIYTIRVVDNESGCERLYTIDVILNYYSELDIPNAFTPNNDGINDIYRLFGKDIQELSFKIYSQWGELLFEGKDFQDTWDGTFKGKAIASGILLLQVEAAGKDGQRFEQTKKINLIR